MTHCRVFITCFTGPLFPLTRAKPDLSRAASNNRERKRKTLKHLQSTEGSRAGGPRVAIVNVCIVAEEPPHE